MAFFQTSDQQQESERHSLHIQAEQIRQIYKAMPLSVIASLANASVLSFVQWPVINHNIVLIWLCSILVITTGRTWLAYAFKRKSPNATDIRPWSNRFFIGTLLAGSAWGAAGVLLFPADNIAHQVFVSFVLAGMTAGAVTTLSSQIKSAMVFISLCLLPLTISFFIAKGTMALAMGAMTLLFFALVMSSARRIYLNILENISLRLRAAAREEMLRSNENLLKQTGKIANVGGWKLDIESDVLSWTDQTYMIHELPFSYQPEVSTSIEFYSDEAKPKLRQAIQEAVYKGSSWDMELPLITAKGNQRWVRTIGQAQFTDGTIKQLTGAIQDITDRKQAEEAIKQASEAALDAARTKSAFLANMSHEIRTPMHGILGTLQLTRKTQLDATQHNYLNIMNRSANDLLTIIDDILDFSKIEAGKLKLEVIDFDVRETLEDVVVLLAQRAHDKGLDLESSIAADLSDKLRGDPQRLRQVLINLVGNAVKFTDKGEVIARIRLQKEEKTRVYLRFEINDTGIGIAPEAKCRLFNSFEQADKSMTRKYGGTGLGLAISKQLVELMGGEIGVDSTLGEGTTFWFQIPFNKSTQPQDKPDHDLHGQRALVVDSNNTVRGILKDYLSYWGAHVDDTDSLQSASTKLDNAAQNSPYNFLFLADDIKGGNSLQWLQQIKPSAPPNTTSVVIMSKTPHENHGQQSESDIYLTKPIRFASLYESIAIALNSTKCVSNTTKQDTGATPAEFSGNILLVEDNIINQAVTGEMLRIMGFNVVVADNGLQAVDATEKTHYDLVLMDCQMPQMDGFEATQLIRQREQQQHQPRHLIIALTANAMQGDRDRCYQAGMDDYLPKPFEEQEFRNKLAQWLSNPGAREKRSAG